jgi:hypothetical protein
LSSGIAVATVTGDSTSFAVTTAQKRTEPWYLAQTRCLVPPTILSIYFELQARPLHDGWSSKELEIGETLWVAINLDLSVVVASGTTGST